MAGPRIASPSWGSRQLFSGELADDPLEEAVTNT